VKTSGEHVTLRFSSEDALRIAIASLVDSATMSKPVRAWRDAERGVLVRPKSLDAKTLAELRERGVEQVDVSPPAEAVEARCWAEVVALRRIDQDLAERVMFLAPDASAMLDTAAELLRLGCDRQEALRVAGSSAILLRAVAPPFYTVARAVDRVGGLRALVPVTERVWVEVGWTHPLATTLHPAEGELLLLSPNEPWRIVPEGSWTTVYSLLDVDVPGDPRRYEARADDLPRLRVPLRLERGADTAPTLWVVRSEAIRKVERLVASVPDDVIGAVLFAVTNDDPPTVILRLRPSSKRAMVLEIDGDAFCPHMQIQSLFLPRGRALEPPLRRDIVRELLAPDADCITWLVGAAASLRVERIPDAAFRPLSSWVEYVVDSARELETWIQSARFEFADYVIEEAPARLADDDDERAPAEPKKRGGRERKQPEPLRERARAEPEPKKRAERPVETRDEPPPSKADNSAIIAALSAAEGEFLALTTPGDDPERVAMWRRMAQLNTRAGRAKDATLCWTRALWSLKGDVREVVDEWARAEATGRTAEELLTIAQPTREQVSALAALLTQASLSQESKVDTAKTAVWLDRHDEAIDLRSMWLARAALSRLVGRDRLGLARARDRVLQKLHGGLSLDRDVPTFLRVVTVARDPSQIEQLAARVQSLVKKYEKTKRRVSTVEAPPSLTLAYVLFIAACGLARLGRAEQARAHAERARKLLDLDEPVHGFLARAYLARVEQAIEGQPPETPLPADVATRLNVLDTFARYKVDRVRQFSNVLEPHERLDPVVAFHRGEKDPRGAEFEDLRGVSDVAVLESAVLKIMGTARKANVDERARLYDGIMDFFPMISMDLAIAQLEIIASTVAEVLPPRRAQLLEEALMLAGHFGHEDLARRLFAGLKTAIAAMDAESTASMAAVIGGTLRTLRRVGLPAEASALLEVMQGAAKGEAAAARVARVHAAAALAYVGSFDRAKPMFDEALATLKKEMPMPSRLEVTRALARAVSHAPVDYATATLDAMTDRLESITDSFNTNSHVCVSVIAFMESIIFGYASEDLGVSEAGRQRLDEDEYLIRKRIQRETSAT
jgi:cellulose synthase operon protein C